MSGLVDAAAAILGTSARRLEAAAQNIANVSTPGYKRRLKAPALAGDGGYAATLARVRHDLGAGKLSQTDRPLDLAINGDGWFQLRQGDAILYSRQGSFRLQPDGTVTTANGAVLQQAGGGDLILGEEGVRIAADGTVFERDQPVARIGVFRAPDTATLDPVDGAAFRLTGDEATAVDTPQIRQGMIEASNVSVGDEMVTMMAAMRQAESGARLVQTWDELMGRAITSFGQGGGR